MPAIKYLMALFFANRTFSEWPHFPHLALPTSHEFFAFVG